MCECVFSVFGVCSDHDSVPVQISVFNHLLKFWQEFQELRKLTPEEKLLPLLQEKRIKHTARVRRRRRKEEEEESRRAQVRTCRLK